MPIYKTVRLAASFIHVFVSNLYIRTIVPQKQYSNIGGQIVGIYKSVADT
jgi:hypothetical protein